MLNVSKYSVNGTEYIFVASGPATKGPARILNAEGTPFVKTLHPVTGQSGYAAPDNIVAQGFLTDAQAWSPAAKSETKNATIARQDSTIARLQAELSALRA